MLFYILWNCHYLWCLSFLLRLYRQIKTLKGLHNLQIKTLSTDNLKKTKRISAYKNCEFDYNYSSVQLKCAFGCVCNFNSYVRFYRHSIRGFYNVLVDDGEVNHHCVTWVRYYKILKCWSSRWSWSCSLYQFVSNLSCFWNFKFLKLQKGWKSVWVTVGRSGQSEL